MDADLDFIINYDIKYRMGREAEERLDREILARLWLDVAVEHFATVMHRTASRDVPSSRGFRDPKVFDGGGDQGGGGEVAPMTDDLRELLREPNHWM